MRVGLVVDLQDPRRIDARQAAADLGVLGLVVGVADARQVVQEQHHVRIRDRVPAAGHADALDLVLGVAQARRVADVQRHALDLDGLAQLVPRRARDRRHDRQLGAGQRVQQRALADIRLPRQHDLDALAQDRALAAAIEQRLHPLQQPAQLAQRIGLLEEIDLLLGEVQGGFDQHPQLDQAVAQPADLAAERTGQRPTGAARGGFGAGVDQVGDGLGLRQVQLAVEEGAARELTRLGQPHPQRGIGLQAARQQQLQHHRAAVGLQFQHMLAGVGMRRREEQRQAVVDRLALGATEGQVGRLSRLERAATDRRHQRGQVLWRGHPHDADGPASGRGGDGGDGILVSRQHGRDCLAASRHQEQRRWAARPHRRHRGWRGAGLVAASREPASCASGPPPSRVRWRSDPRMDSIKRLRADEKKPPGCGGSCDRREELANPPPPSITSSSR